MSFSTSHSGPQDQFNPETQPINGPTTESREDKFVRAFLQAVKDALQKVEVGLEHVLVHASGHVGDSPGDQDHIQIQVNALLPDPDLEKKLGDGGEVVVEQPKGQVVPYTEGREPQQPQQEPGQQPGQDPQA